MTLPSEVHARSVDCYAQQGLLARRKCYALCEGILRPRVIVDRKAEVLPGFEALMYHEGTHAYEYHALAGAIILGVAILSASFAVALAAPCFLLVTVATLGMWLWWMREREVRADAIALYGAGRAEFRAMLMLHAHPRGWFWRWVYGQSISHREVRARRRCEAHGWRPLP